MAGLSQKLSSLVKTAPELVPYTVDSLGKGMPPAIQGSDKGFNSRVESLRRHIAMTSGPLMLFSYLEQVRQSEQDKLEDAVLKAGEKLLAVKLFQQSSLQLFLNRLPTEKPEVLQKLVKDKNPLVRWFVSVAIGRRHLHFEADLIENLNDPHPAVRDVAHKALVHVARGTDFGPL